jgi:FkbM family methyltransferase
MRPLLNTKRLTEIVDVGANPIDGCPPYKQMLEQRLCHVTGFEPQEQALNNLLTKKGPNERYFPYVVADGETHTLNICRYSGMTSLLEPEPAALDLFDDLKINGQIIQKVHEVQTRRLDDIDEIEHIDLLKIDIQGGELHVFQSGQKKLSNAVTIQTEVSFIRLYKNQPTFGEIDIELRSRGFVIHCLPSYKRFTISPFVARNPRYMYSNQLVDADFVYIKDITRPDDIDDEQLKHLALIAHYCYGSFDLALRCIMLLEYRKSISHGAQQSYLRWIDNA